jgi:hypothetical protein
MSTTAESMIDVGSLLFPEKNPLLGASIFQGQLHQLSQQTVDLDLHRDRVRHFKDGGHVEGGRRFSPRGLFDGRVFRRRH